ncbi:MAG: site-specific DNA-methyltransferase, partial [Planctomycetota bacterium]|nr:site-specific DNA-methyltransferase [Planctomycetota bacterium]
DYLDFSRTWLSQAIRVLKPTGTLYVFMGVRFISYLYEILDDELNCPFNSWITWHYTQGMGRKRGFSPRHDDILMFNMSDQFTFNLDAVRVPQKYYRSRNNMRGANPGDVWEFSHVHYCQKNRQSHPTQKPEALIERMVLASSDEGDLVLDPFVGSGTTPRVCQQLGRRFLGFEINPDYVALAQERLGAEFSGFDGVDPRMARVPKDMRDPELRRAYLEKHPEWFLKNHEGCLDLFEKRVLELYGE